MIQKILFYRVLLEVCEPSKKTEGGILLPEQAVEDRRGLVTVGKVLQVGALAFKSKTRAGDDYTVHQDDVKPGVHVLIARHGGQSWNGPDGKRYTIVNDNEVLGIVDEKDVPAFVETMFN